MHVLLFIPIRLRSVFERSSLVFYTVLYLKCYLATLELKGSIFYIKHTSDLPTTFFYLQWLSCCKSILSICLGMSLSRVCRRTIDHFPELACKSLALRWADVSRPREINAWRSQSLLVISSVCLLGRHWSKVSSTHQSQSEILLSNSYVFLLSDFTEIPCFWAICWGDTLSYLTMPCPATPEQLAAQDIKSEPVGPGSTMVV